MFLIVSTPSNALGGFSLRYVLGACDEIGAALADKAGQHTVALVSTVLPGSSDTSGVGGGINRVSGTTPAVTLFNTIVGDNFKGSGTITRDDIAGNVNALGSFNNLVTAGFGGLRFGVNGNIIGDAVDCFDPDAGSPRTLLRSSGPCINAGAVAKRVDLSPVTFQLDGGPRTLGSAPDIGCCERR